MTCNRNSFSTTMLKKTNNVQNSLQNNMKEELKEEKTNLEDVCKDFRMNILNPPKEKSDRMPAEEQLYMENKENKDL